MPIWLQVLASVGGLSGIIALIGALVGFGRVLERIEHIADVIKDVPQMVVDLAVLKARIDTERERPPRRNYIHPL